MSASQRPYSSLVERGLTLTHIHTPHTHRVADVSHTTPGMKRPHSSLVERSLGATAAAALGGTLSGGARRALASGASDVSMLELPDEAYTILGGDMKSCKILNGNEVRNLGRCRSNPHIDTLTIPRNRHVAAERRARVQGAGGARRLGHAQVLRVGSVPCSLSCVTDICCQHELCWVRQRVSWASSFFHVDGVVVSCKQVAKAGQPAL